MHPLSSSHSIHLLSSSNSIHLLSSSHSIHLLSSSHSIHPFFDSPLQSNDSSLYNYRDSLVSKAFSVDLGETLGDVTTHDSPALKAMIERGKNGEGVDGGGGGWLGGAGDFWSLGRGYFFTDSTAHHARTGGGEDDDDAGVGGGVSGLGNGILKEIKQIWKEMEKMNYKIGMLRRPCGEEEEEEDEVGVWW